MSETCQEKGTRLMRLVGTVTTEKVAGVISGAVMASNEFQFSGKDSHLLLTERNN